jgi:hypothetical protein
LKIVKIDGEIPLISPKTVKMRNFSSNKRKIFPYLPQYRLHFKFNGKFSAYFSTVDFPIQDRIIFMLGWFEKEGTDTLSQPCPGI